jgi:aspartate aminotransferase-like enzyme
MSGDGGPEFEFGRFFLPGPTDVRLEVLQAMVRPMFAHRGPEMIALLQRLEAPLKRLFRTTHPVFVSTNSATGFMEAAILSGVRERVLVVDGGFFGDRFARIAARCGKEVVRVSVPIGRTIEPDQLLTFLDGPPVDAVALVHSETSTGALAPLQELARVVHAQGDIVLLVDAVTSIGGSPVETDLWGLDFVFTGSQKALALPPGISIAVASPRMMERAHAAEHPGWYFDLTLHEEAVRQYQPTQTPVLPLYLALEHQLNCIEADGGVEKRWQRHREMLGMMEAWVAAHPAWRFYAVEGRRSWTVSALQVPPGKSGRAVAQAMKARGWTIGTGLDALADAMIRIGHMGDLTPEHFAPLLAALDEVVR